MFSNGFLCQPPLEIGGFNCNKNDFNRWITKSTILEISAKQTAPQIFQMKSE